MAADFVYEKISLWRTAWAEFKASKDVWWRWVAAYILISTLITASMVILVPITELDQKALKQHPEMIFQFFRPLVPGLLIIACLYVVAYYLFTTVYLRYAVKNNPPDFSVGNFFFWLRKLVMKYLRPLPWLLLAPVFGIGMFFYYRSIFRRFIVGPMALLRREPVLQGSWDLTKDNVWRIIWGSIVLNIIILLIMIGVMLIPGLIWGIITHGDRHSLGYTIGHAFFNGMSMGISIMANAIYSCTVYRVLLREQKAAGAAAIPNNPTPA